MVVVDKWEEGCGKGFRVHICIDCMVSSAQWVGEYQRNILWGNAFFKMFVIGEKVLVVVSEWELMGALGVHLCIKEYRWKIWYGVMLPPFL